MERQRSLPNSVYTNSRVYDLEREKIFRPAWYLVGTPNKFHEIGKPVEYEIAGKSFQVIQVSSGVFEARMKDDNRSLLRIYETKTGAIFVCLDKDALPFNEYYRGLEELLDRVDFRKIPFRTTCTTIEKFNWKLAVDNFQECLHCDYAHPAFVKKYPTHSYAVENHENFSRHLSDPNRSNPDDGLFLFLFPSCTLNVYNGGMSSFRICPIDTNTVRLEYDYYFDGNQQEYEEYFKFVRNVAIEDFELCEKVQKNLIEGVYETGLLNPLKENGVLYSQELVAKKLLSH